jgi:hypothetical protein
MTIGQFLALRWEDPGIPLIEPPWPSPVLADPTFLFPHETPGHNWLLFAHDAFGLRRYESDDGLSWESRGRVLPWGMRPFVRRVKEGYILAYERYRPFALPMQMLPRRPSWKSSIELRMSADAVAWSEPVTLLESSFFWSDAGALGQSVSNPCLVPIGLPGGVGRPGGATPGSWRLWFSASLVTIPDCGFDEPKFIGASDAPSIHGPFSAPPAPLLDPASDAAPGALGAGSIKVLELEDGWIGLQNKLTQGAEDSSRSALFILRSSDGLHFELARDEPLLAPSPGWRSSHVYACDFRINPTDGAVYLYFNARDGAYKSEGRERIGRIVGLPSA